MAFSDEIAYMSAADLAASIRERKLSPVEVVDGFIERIEIRNPSLNAFIYTGFDEARESAKAAERAVTSGEELGIFHGVPTAIKDLFDFKPGWPATFGGIPAMKDFALDTHCVFAERIENAGAIILGKGNSSLMGFRGACDNPLFGATRNPFDTDLNSGGSSGGPSAAVADGLIPFAEGTDAGGSIRIPAAWCNLYGFKGSFGRVPVAVRPNLFGSIIPFIAEGPLTRTVEDSALAMNAISGYDPRDPFSLDEKPDFTAALGRSIKGMRIAYSADLGSYPVDSRIAKTVADAVRVFEQAGAHVDVVDFSLPFDQHELSDLWCRQTMLLNIDTLENLKANGLDLIADHSDDLPTGYLRWAEEVYAMTVPEVSRDYSMRSAVFDSVQSVFADYDLLVTPTLASMQVPNSPTAGQTMGPSEINGVSVDEYIGWCLTYFVNFTGHPAASIPAGMVDGLPVGMQLIGKRYADEDVLAASSAFEKLQPWVDNYKLAAARDLNK